MAGTLALIAKERLAASSDGGSVCEREWMFEDWFSRIRVAMVGDSTHSPDIPKAALCHRAATVQIGAILLIRPPFIGLVSTTALEEHPGCNFEH